MIGNNEGIYSRVVCILNDKLDTRILVVCESPDNVRTCYYNTKTHDHIFVPCIYTLSLPSFLSNENVLIIQFLHNDYLMIGGVPPQIP